MIKLPNTLSVRLTLWYSSAFTIFLSCAFVIIYFSIQTVLENRLDEDLEEDIEEFALLFEQEDIERVKEEIGREVASGEEDKVFLRLLNFSGKVLFSSDLQHWPELSTDDELVTSVQLSDEVILETEEFSDKEEATRMVYGVIAPGVILHIGESTEEIVEFMAILQIVFGLMMVLVIPVSAYVGWFMAIRALQGVYEVSRAATEIERGHLDRRVELEAPTDEVKRLADTFNAMVDRVQGLIMEMREMTDNIAHDLRSPLARIRIISEMILSRKESSASDTIKDCEVAAADVIEECDRLLQMINTTLDVAEAEAGASNMARGIVDVSQLVRDACELFEPVAEEKNIVLVCNLDRDCQLEGNEQYLQRMLANLLDNAFKYTPSGGEVTVTLSCAGDYVDIRVSDTGSGVEKADQSRIFERFFRCDQSRSEQGCGLGLSFSRAVAHSHDGEISVESELGRGSQFTISLPRMLGAS
jgi:heavy metal sensor kinase